VSSRTGARLAAFTALVGVTVTLAIVLMRDSDGAAPVTRGPSVAVLTDETETVSREIERLRRGHSGRRAQRAVRAAIDAAEALRDDPAANADPLTANAIERDLEYLDAVGSVLSNPRSTLRPELDERGRRARAALEAAPGGRDAAAATRGWEHLLEYAEKRARR
jgi:uncharacterized membrane protein YccC